MNRDAEKAENFQEYICNRRSRHSGVVHGACSAQGSIDVRKITNFNSELLADAT